MARKVLLGCMAAALALAGCTTAREKSAPPPPAPTAPTPAPAPAQTTTAADKPKPRPAARPTPRPIRVAATPTRADLPAMIGAGATWTVPGSTLAVNRGNTPARQAVPIFRQAGALATVRAALADSPARPQAEFRNGVLTLTFDRGSNEDIAAAVNKTLSVTGGRSLQVALQP